MNKYPSQPARREEPRVGWWPSFPRNGYYVRHVAIVTLLLGASVHLAVVLLGRSVLPRIVTPPFELVLTMPMVYVSVMGWFAWRQFRFRNRAQKVLLALILVYFPIGIPLHVLTILTGSTDHYAAIPEWYSFVILPVMLAMVFLFATLRNANRTQGDAGR